RLARTAQLAQSMLHVLLPHPGRNGLLMTSMPCSTKQASTTSNSGSRHTRRSCWPFPSLTAGGAPTGSTDSRKASNMGQIQMVKDYRGVDDREVAWALLMIRVHAALAFPHQI